MTNLQQGPPAIPLDLVEYLEAVYPETFPMADIGPDPHAVAAAMNRRAGRLDVVRFLRDHATRQASQAAPTTKKSRKTSA